MDKSIKKIVFGITASIFILLIVIIINQLYQIFVMTSAIDPDFGKAVTAVLGSVFIILFFLPMIGFFKLQKPLIVPDETDQAAYNTYLSMLKKRFTKNKYLIKAGYNFDDSKPLKEQVQEAIDVLDRETLDVMKEASSTVFITTAVSQNGALDSLFVMYSISKLIWKVSHIYNQRPSIKELFYIYALSLIHI